MNWAWKKITENIGYLGFVVSISSIALSPFFIDNLRFEITGPLTIAVGAFFIQKLQQEHNEKMQKRQQRHNEKQLENQLTHHQRITEKMHEDVRRFIENNRAAIDDAFCTNFLVEPPKNMMDKKSTARTSHTLRTVDGINTMRKEGDPIIPYKNQDIVFDDCKNVFLSNELRGNRESNFHGDIIDVFLRGGIYKTEDMADIFGIILYGYFYRRAYIASFIQGEDTILTTIEHRDT